MSIVAVNRLQIKRRKRFVVEGAHQHRLPPEYIAILEAVEAIEDPDKARNAKNRGIHC